MAGLVALFIWQQSSLSEEEHGELVATYMAIVLDIFRCESCLARFAPDELGQKNSAHWRGHWGCFGGDGKTFVKKFGMAFQTCPGNFTSHEVRGWMELWKVWNAKNLLPYPGSILEQPAKLTEIFATLTGLEDERRKDQDRETQLLKGPVNE